MRIAYQGEPGAFSEAASRQLAGDAELRPCKSFEDVFAAVDAGTVDYGVLPIENSIGGSIHRNFDLLLEHTLTIVGELEVPGEPSTDSSTEAAEGEAGAATVEAATADGDAHRTSNAGHSPSRRQR